jgi:Na+-transporting methylmalonyl-CoA/oxaloacetate decarboxylase gamma subunit
MSGQISIAEALQITAICMGIVFITLYVISLIIELFKVVFKEKKVSKVPNISETKMGKVIKELTTEEEIVVALTAAINISSEKRNSKLRIVSYKQMG